MLSFEIEESEIPQHFSDNLFDLMCMKSGIKDEELFNSFYHDNYYVKHNIKKIYRY
jgi:hypothetical protein